MIGNSCIQQFDVKADVERDTDGDWYVSTIYSDVIEQDGKCPQGECYVEIPSAHPLHKDILMHFLTKCHDDIEERWRRRRSYRYQSTISAGRTFA
jgi:hypothetical protein